MSMEEQLESLAPTQQKKEFRDYLHKHGVVDSLMRVLASLYEAKDLPNEEQKIEEFLRARMGELVGVDYDAMKKENTELKKKNSELTKQIEELERSLRS